MQKRCNLSMNEIDRNLTMRKSIRTALLTLPLASLLCCFIRGQEPKPETSELLKKVGARVREVQESLYKLAWTRTYRVQKLSLDLEPLGKPTESITDVMMLRKPSGSDPVVSEPVLHLELKSVNGNPPKKSKFQEPSSRVNETQPESLSFLLPGKQSEYH